MMNKESMGPGPQMGFEMMSKMMEMCGCEENMGKMHDKMAEMMPKRLEMILPSFPKEKRIEFIDCMVKILINAGTKSLNDDEKNEVLDGIIKSVEELRA